MTHDKIFADALVMLTFCKDRYTFQNVALLYGDKHVIVGEAIYNGGIHPFIADCSEEVLFFLDVSPFSFEDKDIIWDAEWQEKHIACTFSSIIYTGEFMCRLCKHMEANENSVASHPWSCGIISVPVQAMLLRKHFSEAMVRAKKAKLDCYPSRKAGE